MCRRKSTRKEIACRSLEILERTSPEVSHIKKGGLSFRSGRNKEILIDEAIVIFLAFPTP